MRLRSDHWQAEIAPERGGWITGLQSRGVDVLRPEAGAPGLIDGLPLFGCFPMMPFANRLNPPLLPTSGRPVVVPMNWPGEAMAIHGTVWDKPWQVARQSDSMARLSVDVIAGGLLLGRGDMTVQLSDRVEIELGFHCLHPDGLAAGIGLHPWFDCAGESRVGFRAGAPLQIGDVFAGGPDQTHNLTMRADRGRDCCFPRWFGTASLSVPHWPGPLEIRSTAPFLHVFMAGDFGAICLEPVSHYPNAQNLGQSVPLLPNGARIAMATSLQWLDEKDQTT